MSAVEQFLAYNFDGDADFQVSPVWDCGFSFNNYLTQKGLATLLGNAPPNHDADYLTGRAKAFYFSKCGMDVFLLIGLMPAKGRPA
jgi:hypothetical protein